MVREEVERQMRRQKAALKPSWQQDIMTLAQLLRDEEWIRAALARMVADDDLDGGSR
jgi:hypothetical protein